MQYSQTVEYALRAALWLAENPHTPQTTVQIAEGSGMPAGYLSKVLQPMARHNLVTAQRGLGGGFTLARPPEQISLLQIISAVEPIRRLKSCPLHRNHQPGRLCKLHARLDDVLATTERYLESITLIDVIDQPSHTLTLSHRANGPPDGQADKSVVSSHDTASVTHPTSSTTTPESDANKSSQSKHI